jgi:K+-sensing histidine kinase KdpD
LMNMAVEQGEAILEIPGSRADSRLERSWMMRAERVLAGSSPWVAIVIGILLLVLVGLVDAASGSFEVSVFYFLPIALVTFGRGRWMGILLSGLVTLGWSAVEVVRGVSGAFAGATYWSAMSRFYAFVAVCLVIAPMREALIQQRELAEREAALAERLRALNELREAMSSLEVEAGRETDPRVDELFGVLHALDRDWTDTSA